MVWWLSCTASPKPWEGAGRHIGAVLALPAAGVVLLAAFVAVERRAAHPLLPLRVVRHRDRAGSLLASLLTGAGMFGMLLFLTYYLQVDLGYTPLQAGLAFLPFSGGIVAASVLGAGLVTRLGPRALMVGGIAVAAAGMLWLAYVAALNGYLAGRRSASGQWIQAVPMDGYLHGYRTAFLAAGGLFVLALVLVAVMVTRSVPSTGTSATR